MVEQASVSSALSPHSSEDELYKSDLDACIEGIEKFPVNKRRVSVGKRRLLLSHSVSLLADSTLEVITSLSGLLPSVQ